jgi:hypothetical protein
MTGFWICIVIALAVVVRRVLALTFPTQGDGSARAQLDAAFSGHTALTLSHILPAAAFVVIAAIVMLRPQSWRRFSAAFFVLGLITGLTAYAMSAYPVGGWTERSAVLFFNSWFLFSLAQAFRWSRKGEFVAQRRWTVRAVVVLLGIATTRPVMGVFFATASRTGLTPHDFFGLAFWIGFSINAIVAELWLASRKAKPRYSTALPAAD